MYRVLYVDDEPDLLEIGSIYLSASRVFCIETATSAEEVLDGGDLQSFDAIISDYQMPGMDGITFLKQVRSVYGKIPFILFTGRGREEVVIEAIDNGVDFYVQKGGDPASQFAELEHKILQGIESQRQREALMESEVRFRSLFTSMLNGFAHHRIICDAEGRPVDYRFIDVNPAFERMTGLKRDDILGKTVLEVLPETEPFWIERYGWTALTGEAQSFEHFTAPLSKFFDVTVYSPKAGEFTTLFSDITERKRAEERDRESEQRYRDLVENLNDVIFTVDTDGIITYVSPAGERFGYHPSDLLGRPFRDVVFAEDQPALLSRFQEIKEGIIVPLEWRIIQKDGSLCRVRSSTRPGVNTGGTPGFWGILTDISGEIQAMEALKKSEIKFRTMVETSPDMIWEVDTRAVFTYLSPQITGTLGYAPEEMIGRSIFTILPEGSVPDLEDRYLLHRESWEGMHTFEASARHQDGRLRSVEIRSVPIRDSDRTIAGFRGIARDITEQKISEEARRDSEAKYRLLADHVHDVIWTADMDMHLSYISPSITTLRGLTPDEALAEPIEEALTPASLQTFIRHRQQGLQVLKNGGSIPISQVMELEFFHKDGSTVWTEMVISIVLNSAGMPVGVVGVTREITERMHASEASGLSHTLLEIANRPLDCSALLQEYLSVIRKYTGCEVGGIQLYDQTDPSLGRAWSGCTGEGEALRDPLPIIVDDGIITAVIDGTTDPMQPFFTAGGSFFTPSARSPSSTQTITIPKKASDRDWNHSPKAGFESVSLIPLRHGDQIKGLICLADRQEKRILLTQLQVLEEVTGQMYTAIQRVAAEDQIRRSLAEKEVLMKELHHRVKNNLAVIISLIDLQTDETSDDQTLQLLLELQGRVATMALVHEFLYESRDLSQVNFGEYLQDLVPRLIQAQGGATPVDVQYRVDETLIPLEIAIPCGLIVNELVTNTQKYAFPTGKPGHYDPAIPGAEGAPCRITITFGKTDGTFILSVGDNGVGFPAGFEWSSARTLGLQLVQMLGCHQLRGQVDYEERDGAWFTIQFPAQ